VPRVRAWERLNIDSMKMVTFSTTLSIGSGALVYSITERMMASDSVVLGAIVAIMVFYLSCSLSKRIEASASLSQAKEAPALAVLGSATLEATRSRAKAVLLLKSDEDSIASALESVSRKVLLGCPPGVAVRELESLSSGSALEVLQSLASPESSLAPQEGEEVAAIENSSRLSEETRSPLFMAAAFFTPLMLLLYVVMAHVGGAAELAELVVLQIVLLDIAFYFSTSDPGRTA